MDVRELLDALGTVGGVCLLCSAAFVATATFWPLSAFAVLLVGGRGGLYGLSYALDRVGL